MASYDFIAIISLTAFVDMVYWIVSKVVAKKSLGQHFLFNNFYLDEIIRWSIGKFDDMDSVKKIIEIGPGLGTLTAKLREHKQTVCVEKDRDLAAKLQDKWNNVMCLCEDALMFDFTQIANAHDDILVANLPYNISALLILNFLKQPYVRRYCVLIQKEMADRLAAKPKTKDYGGLSVLTQAFANVRLCFNIPGSVFKPKTKVESTFVVLESKMTRNDIMNKRQILQAESDKNDSNAIEMINDKVMIESDANMNNSEQMNSMSKSNNMIENESQKLDPDCVEVDFDKLQTIVKICFANRRKMLRNVITDELKDVFEKMQIPLTCRAEDISVEQFVKMAQLMS